MYPVAREMIAYAIMGASAVVALPAFVIAARRRHREKLRRRGDKRYGH
jgi:hypothetical protein